MKAMISVASIIRNSAQKLDADIPKVFSVQIAVVGKNPRFPFDHVLGHDKGDASDRVLAYIRDNQDKYSILVKDVNINLKEIGTALFYHK